MLGEINTSVRPLVEYVYSSGSIETGFKNAAAMTEGTKAHQKIQKLYKENDQMEVYLHTQITLDEVMFKIDGRCDGLLFINSEFVIDEIKSTKKDLQLISSDSYPVHWAQAKCYAYMYAKENKMNKMTVQLTYVHVETEEQMIFQETLSFSELEAFLFEVLRAYIPYATLRLKHEFKRNKSIHELAFPFDAFRKGQRTFAGAVYKTISEGKNLFANAPTGIGKTISATFPSIKAMGEGHINKLFYLTAKTITRQVAEEALFRMEEKGLCLHSVTITAKEKVCFKEKVICQKDFCEFANGYYDRINGAILDILEHESVLTRNTIEKYAIKHSVCPFEFSLDLAYTADAVICDYNYIFDPKVSLKRLLDEQKRQTVLLIDEAHNLVDRAREMYSAEINKSVFLKVKNEFKQKKNGIFLSSKKINDYFIKLKKQNAELPGFTQKEMPEELIHYLDEFMDYAEKELLLQNQGHSNDMLLDSYFMAYDFIRASKLYNDRFVTYIEKTKNDVSIKMLCLDPSELLTYTGKRYRSKIFFSATLLPMSFFKDMLGADTEDYHLTVPSPFSSDQTNVSIYPLSTKYNDREKSIKPIADMLYELVHNNPGNYLVFFPSYSYMNDVYEEYMSREIIGNTLVQGSGMSEEDREHYLSAFQAEAEEPLLGFAVLGGIFSEGIDLKGDRLNGVVVVGVGLPQLGIERNIMKEYFNEIGKNGYDYAYVYPGMNKILQAGGRLIRSETDHGTIILVDDRFLTPKYQKLLPPEWKDFKVIK